MEREDATNSWSWHRNAVGAARNGRTALLLVVALSLAVAVAGPEETFTLYGRIATGQDVSAYAGRLVFMGMGVVQATAVAAATALASLVLRAAVPLAKVARVRLAPTRPAGEKEVAHV